MSSGWNEVGGNHLGGDDEGAEIDVFDCNSGHSFERWDGWWFTGCAGSEMRGVPRSDRAE